MDCDRRVQKTTGLVLMAVVVQHFIYLIMSQYGDHGFISMTSGTRGSAPRAKQKSEMTKTLHTLHFLSLHSFNSFIHEFEHSLFAKFIVRVFVLECLHAVLRVR